MFTHACTELQCILCMGNRNVTLEMKVFENTVFDWSVPDNVKCTVVMLLRVYTREWKSADMALFSFLGDCPVPLYCVIQ